MPNSLIHEFEESLWARSYVGRRSTEATPLYIERYRGMRLESIPRSHKFHEFTCTLAESGQLYCDSCIELRKNVVCLIPAGVPHRESSQNDLDTIWIGFRATTQSFATPSVVSVEDVELTGLFEKIWIHSRARGEPIGPELDGMLETVLGCFFRLLKGRKSASGGGLGTRLVEHLESQFEEQHTVADLAKRFGCSEGYLHRCFKDKTGVSPMAYLRKIRMHRAMLLLRKTTLPVAEIAAMVGYPDAFYFSRVFHEVAGESPKTYRQTMRKSEDF